MKPDKAPPCPTCGTWHAPGFGHTPLNIYVPPENTAIPYPPPSPPEMREAVGAESKKRNTYLLLSDFERLEDWCQMVRVIFDSTPYLVGSATERADYRDVDIRVVLDARAFRRLSRGRLDTIRYINRAISTWGQRETGLPIDFQVQCDTDAAEPPPVHAMGVRDWTITPTSGV